MFGHECEILSDLLGMGLQGGEHAAAAVRVGESGIVFRMVVRLVEARAGGLSAKLVIEATIRPKRGEPVFAAEHQITPWRGGRAGQREHFTGKVHQEGTPVRFVIELDVGAAPYVLHADGFAFTAAIVFGCFVDEMALVIKRHMAAGLLDFFDVCTKYIRTAERRADFQIRILVVMAGMIPSEEADRVATMGLGEFVKLWQGVIWPHFVTELLFVDDKKISCHVLNPFGACRLRTILRHPCGVVLRALMPIAVIEIKHGFRNGH